MMKLDVGICRKIGESNYGSRSASVNLVVELDSSFAAEPEKLQQRIRDLFGLARASSLEELNGNSNGGNVNGHIAPATASGLQPNAQNGNGTTNGHANGQPDSNGQRTGGRRPATASQVRAIHAIARSLKINVFPFLQDHFNASRPDDLSLSDASAAIDELKSTHAEGE